MSYKIEEIEGIGPANAKKLGKANIKTTSSLLKLSCTRKGRRDVAEATGVSEKQLLRWANMADLMRINGIGQEFSELLEAAGVDTIKELRKRRADNLTKKMADVNGKKKLTRRVPAQSMVEDWVAQAKKLKPVISH